MTEQSFFNVGIFRVLKKLTLVNKKYKLARFSNLNLRRPTPTFHHEESFSLVESGQNDRCG